MLTNENARSKKFLDRVYDYLETIDVTKLSWDELKDYLEVVQKGQFLESIGTTSSPFANPYGFGVNKPVCSAPSVTTGSGEGMETSVG